MPNSSLLFLKSLNRQTCLFALSIFWSASLSRCLRCFWACNSNKSHYLIITFSLPAPLSDFRDTMLWSEAAFWERSLELIDYTDLLCIDPTDFTALLFKSLLMLSWFLKLFYVNLAPWVPFPKYSATSAPPSSPLSEATLFSWSTWKIFLECPFKWALLIKCEPLEEFIATIWLSWSLFSRSFFARNITRIDQNSLPFFANVGIL